MSSKDYPAKLLASYQHGAITSRELANALVITATELPPISFASNVPADVLDVLRVVIWDAEEPAFVFFGVRDLAADLRLWREGLDLWRAYFEGLAHDPARN